MYPKQYQQQYKQQYQHPFPYQQFQQDLQPMLFPQQNPAPLLIQLQQLQLPLNQPIPTQILA